MGTEKPRKTGRLQHPTAGDRTDTWEAHVARGVVAEAAGSRPDALTSYGRALARDPAHSLDAIMAFHEQLLEGHADPGLVNAVVSPALARRIVNTWPPAAAAPEADLARRYEAEARRLLSQGDRLLAAVWLRRALAFSPVDPELEAAFLSAVASSKRAP